MIEDDRKSPNSERPFGVGLLRYHGCVLPAFLDANDAAIWSQILAESHGGSRRWYTHAHGTLSVSFSMMFPLITYSMNKTKITTALRRKQESLVA